ncbi:MAG: rod shape-determining protein [Chloroflexota bacterium]|nr:MAG: rod shape-determining protein [Chloroflexota bacterium]
MAFLSRDIGIDLGTLNILVAEGNQILIQEPTIVAILVEEQKMVEWGKVAKDMLGRVPESIEVVRPLQNGVIADFETTENLLKDILQRVSGPMRVFKPSVMTTVPYGITSVELRAVHEACLGAGAREVALIWQPLAAAIGIDLPISTPSGNMIVSLGGGTTQTAVLAMNGIVSAETLRGGGLHLDESIIVYLRKKYGLIIGQPTAEQLKIKIGSAISIPNQPSMEIQGQDQVTGLPRPLEVKNEDIVEALEEPLREVTLSVKRVLEKTPPELLSDIIDRGVALCGGGALLKGIDKHLTKALGIPAYLVDNPITCTVEGASKGLAMYDQLKRNLPPV